MLPEALLEGAKLGGRPVYRQQWRMSREDGGRGTDITIRVRAGGGFESPELRAAVHYKTSDGERRTRSEVQLRFEDVVADDWEVA